ncbi:MAG: hypothetical protein KAY09_07590 [Nitrospira sp.]|nr:hypothetical protein [Nitrospira sp.]
MSEMVDAKINISSGLRTAQIGKCGELLVQYRLLLLGIESAPMSTDTGVDLVAYSSRTSQALTIQVKTNLRAKPGGGKGKLALDWWVSESVPAQLIALVDLSSEKIWFFTRKEVGELAQQKSSGRLHLYMYTDLAVRPLKRDRLVHSYEFDRFLISNRVADIFGL